MSEIPYEDLSEDATTLLHTLLELFRQQLSPETEALVWRSACLELIDKGIAKIYESEEGFSLLLTPEGEAFLKATG